MRFPLYLQGMTASRSCDHFLRLPFQNVLVSQHGLASSKLRFQHVVSDNYLLSLLFPYPPLVGSSDLTRILCIHSSLFVSLLVIHLSLSFRHRLLSPSRHRCFSPFFRSNYISDFPQISSSICFDLEFRFFLVLVVSISVCFPPFPCYGSLSPTHTVLWSLL